MPVIVLTSGTQWLVPADCQTATIEAVGAGNGNYLYDGGSYAKSTNVSFTPGSLVDISIAAGASGGKTWLNTSSTPRYMPNYITWSGTQFVGLDNTNNIVISPDGFTWTRKPGLTSIFNTQYLSIAANGSNIVVSPNSNTFTQVAISSDSGTSWSAVTLPTGAYNKYPVWFVNGTFIVSSINNSASPPTIYQFASTDNGASWTTTSTRVTSSAPNRIEYNVSPVIYENSLYTTVGSYIPTSGVTPYGVGYSSSASGAQTIITQATLGFASFSVNAIAYGAGVYVVVGGGGRISTAPTLTSSWTPRTSGVTATLTSVIFDGTKFIAAASGVLTSSYYYQVLISSDGITWTLSTTTTTQALGNAPDNSLFNTGSGVYSIAGISISKTSNSGTSWSLIFIGDGSPLSVSTGVSAAGGFISPLVQSINSIYTSGAGNFYQGGTAGANYIGCCFDVQGGYGGGAGPNGQGGNGGNEGAYGAGGGGAANGGGNGAVGGGYVGGFGGTSRTGSLGGAGGTISTPGGSGTNGSGGGGGVATYSTGGAGSLDIISAWTDFTGATYGVGSGGGGLNGPAGGPGGGGTGTLGQGIIVITYTPQPVTGTYTQVFTSSQSVYVPAGITSFTAEAIGPGSAGGLYSAGVQNGGGGGAYSTSTTTSISSGAAYANVPAASSFGSTADSWFSFAGNSVPTSAAQGVLAKGASSGTGGSAASSYGTASSGGNGGASILQTSTANKQRGGGGGGAAGPNGAGKAGGSASTAAATSANGGGGGGGGANGTVSGGGSTAGGTPVITTTTGGVGGSGPTGTSGGSGATTTPALAGSGSNGSGGGGGSAFTTSGTGNNAYRSGGSGSQYPIWTVNGISYGPGSGGGGGGIGVSTVLFGNGGNAGGYGAGGGAASGVSGGTRGNGTGGLVVITYTVVGSGAYTRSIVENASSADASATNGNFFISQTENFSPDDVLSIGFVFNISQTESVNIADSVAVLAQFKISQSENFLPADTPVGGFAYSASLTENITVADVIAQFRAYFASIVENFSPDTSQSISLQFVQLVQETLNSQDFFDSSVKFTFSLVENVNMLDNALVGGWVTITTDQPADWNSITNTQTVAWNIVDSTQTVNWQNVGTIQTSTWTDVDDAQTPGWVPI
jgi:hypothetical protein